ncbi:MAG: hypothetical protein ACSLFQ_23085, partial [Thermoanaerobaculia bacterium]
VQIFLSTGGPGWETIDGWDTSASPCEWYGVYCSYPEGQPPDTMTVFGISLPMNGLRGEFPCDLKDLPNLQMLDLRYNQLTGMVPDNYLERWDRNEFELSLAGNRLSNLVESVELSMSSSGLLCGFDFDSHFRFELSESGVARYQAIRCSHDRETVCKVKEGEGPSLDRLASALRRVKFEQLRSEYSYAHSFTTHQDYVTTTVRWGDGTKKTLETYGGQGPIEAYIVEQLVFALLQQVEWTVHSETPNCSFR